jgi:hypothetical protein
VNWVRANGHSFSLRQMLAPITNRRTGASSSMPFWICFSRRRTSAVAQLPNRRLPADRGNVSERRGATKLDVRPGPISSRVHRRFHRGGLLLQALNT